MNNKKKRIILIGFIAFLIMIMVTIVYIGCRFINYEKMQNNNISNLTGQMEYLQEKLEQITDYYKYETDYKSSSYNYLALGNSLTLISTVGHGICSTRNNNDYVGLLVDYLQKNHMDENGVIFYRYNFSPWERTADRGSTLDLIDPFLSPDLDLITIQLGENASDLSTYEKDMEELIKYIKDAAPNAEIIVIGDFWNVKRNNMRRNAAKSTSVKFADLSDIIGDNSYQSSVGIEFEKVDGSTEIVSEAAATHPGDKGMKYISEKVIEVMEDTER